MKMQSSPGRKFKYRSILVVGNRSQEVLFLSLILQRFKYEVTVANNVAQALERVAASIPALIVCDLVLPGLSGMDLFLLLRQDKRTVSVPVVFMVPMNDAAAEHRCLDLGAAACVSKPVRAEELYQAVQRIIEPLPRADIRIDTCLPVSVNNEPVKCDEGQCRIDLSEHGMFVSMHRPFPKNERISVQLHISQDRTITAEGTVLYSRAENVASNRRPGMGLKFVRMAPQDGEFIRKFIRDEVTRDVRAALNHAAAAPP